MLSFRTFGARLLISITAMALLLAGCSGTKDDSPAAPSSEKPVITGEPAGFNADDIAFARNTIASMQQSIDLATLVPERSTNPELISLAASFSAAQSSDLELLKVFLTQWSASDVDASGRDGQDVVTTGTVDEATVTRLQTLNGPEFDTLWLQTIIGHVQAAVAMARAEVSKGVNVDAVATAKRLVDSLQAEIGQLQPLLPTG